MPITYRPARAGDLEISDRLVVASINNLTQRHGFGPMAASSPPAFQLFSLKDDADGLWVAEEAAKFSASHGAGSAATCGFSRSYSCRPITRAAASAMSCSNGLSNTRRTPALPTGR